MSTASSVRAVETLKPFGCEPPAGFMNPKAPAIGPPQERVSRTEGMVVDLDRTKVAALLDRATLEDIIPESQALPGVVGVYMLTPGEFGAPDSRRLVRFSDGSFVVEQVVERIQSELFRYLVWNYASPRAQAIHHAVGEFRYSDDRPGRIKITWAYSFKLKNDSFLGRLGSLGRLLFKVGFLDRIFAQFMESTMDAMSAYLVRHYVPSDE